MNKQIFKVALMAFAMISFVACNEPGKGQEPTGPEPQTSTESKEYFVSVSQEVINTFNTEDQKDAIALVDQLLWDFENKTFDWGAFEDRYDTDKYTSIWKVSKYVAGVARGKQMATNVSDYTFSFAGESVVFEVVQDTIWKCLGPSDDNSLTIIYYVHGKKCVAKLWGEGKETTYTTNVQWTDYDWVNGYYDENGNWIDGYETQTPMDKTYTAVVPEKIIFTLTEGNTEHVRLNVQLSLEKNHHAHVKLDARVANLTWDLTAKVNTSSAEFAMNYNYGNKSLVKASGAVPSYVVFVKQDNQTWQEWIDKYGEEYETLIHKLGGATANVDLLGKVQVKASTQSGAALYDALIAWDKKYDYDESISHWYEQPYNSKTANAELAAIYNANIDIQMYYDGGSNVQAMVKSDVCDYQTEEYDWETDSYSNVTYYGIMPVLNFPADGTSYEFGNYFTESNFGNVMGWAEELANQYLSLFVMMNFGEVDFH